MKGNFPVERFSSMRTPFYYYDLKLLRDTLSVIAEQMKIYPDFHVHYAVKANFNPAILSEIASRGLGADCVSGGEVKAAVEAGFKPSGIVYAGVGKSDEEIITSLNYGIARFNVESEAELEVISQIATAMGKTAAISLRVNPDVGAHTHANITTGLAENKFGINYEQLEGIMRKALSLPGIEYKGLHFHIGSQILDMQDFVALCNRINSLYASLTRAGFNVGDINVGGGLGINYEHPNHFGIPDFASYFATFHKHLQLPARTAVHFELGRSVVAQCGSLITKVLYIKEGTSKRFAIVDGSMTELIRPALYKAYHRIENISSDEPEEIYDVVGPVCESSDVFLKGTSIDKCHRGDLLAIRSAGAYGEAMASGYNCRPLPPCFLDK